MNHLLPTGQSCRQVVPKPLYWSSLSAISQTRPFDWYELPALVRTATIHEVSFRRLPEQHHQLKCFGGSCSRLVFLVTWVDTRESTVSRIYLQDIQKLVDPVLVQTSIRRSLRVILFHRRRNSSRCPSVFLLVDLASQ